MVAASRKFSSSVATHRPAISVERLATQWRSVVLRYYIFHFPITVLRISLAATRSPFPGVAKHLECATGGGAGWTTADGWRRAQVTRVVDSTLRRRCVF